MPDRISIQKTGSQPARMVWCTSQTANSCHYSILLNMYCYFCGLEISQRQSWLLKQPMLSKLIGRWFMLLLQWHIHNSLCKHWAVLGSPWHCYFARRNYCRGQQRHTVYLLSPCAHTKRPSRQWFQFSTFITF